MSVVKITGDYRARVIVVDGVQLPNVTDIDLKIGLDDMDAVRVKMLAHHVDVEINTDVYVTMEVYPGYDLIEEVLEDGRKRYRAVERA